MSTDPDHSLKDERVTPPLALFRNAHGLDEPEAPTRPGACRRLSEGLVRWLPEGVGPELVFPSFAFADASRARAVGTPAAGSPAIGFGRTRDGRRLVEVPIEAGTTLHGVGMQAHALERSGRSYTCWNTDWPAYDAGNPGLYQSHPFVFCVRADGTCFGVLFDTSWRCDIDLSDPAAIRCRAEGPPFAVHVLGADTPQRLCERIAEVTGQTPMPPLWALGYHQCRWSYYPAGRALRIAEEFRERSIPCDVMWFDIHYMQDYRIFSFHEQRFPDPKHVNDTLHARGFKTVWMIDPAPKKDDSDDVYRTGLEGDHFTLASDGRPFVGSVWAGPSCFPDFTRPLTRAWWADLYRDYMATGIDGVWNDMNEPSVFDERSKTMPETCWHRGGDDLPAAPHSAYHNVYGMLMVKASREGIARANPDKRPFVLTRSNFMGGHRYAATWTGDNSATWTDLALSIPMVLSLALSGQLMSGPDIGGFMDHSEGDPELFARWMGIGCLLPFARAHVAEGCIDKEPWSFGAACEATCRRAIETRYRLLPYLYTIAWRAHRTGAPLNAPLFFADPTDPALRHEDRAFLLGEDVLAICDVLPSGEGHRATPIAMPEHDWRRFRLVEEDPDLPELRLRAGRAIPVGPVIQHTGDARGPLTIIAALDAQGQAQGLLYEDAGDGPAHELGEYRLSRIRVAAKGDDACVELEHLEGDRPSEAHGVRVELV